MILLDTNVVSAVMAPMPERSVLDCLDARPADVLFLPAIAVAGQSERLASGDKPRTYTCAQFPRDALLLYGGPIPLSSIECSRVEMSSSWARRVSPQ